VVQVVATTGGAPSGRERPCCADHEKGSEAVSPVVIVWRCSAGVDAYAADTVIDPAFLPGDTRTRQAQSERVRPEVNFT
jgi:hypothetical protein